MAIGDLITAARYNIIQSKVSNVLSTGSGNSGYGQALQSNQVAQNQLIEDDHMNTLRLDIRKAFLHQNNSYPTLTIVSSANTVDDTNATSNSYVTFETLATNIETNRNTISASRLTTGNTAASYIRTATWNGTRVGNFTVTFGSNNAARHFFNTGGAVQIDMNISVSTTPKVNDWNSLFSTNMGTLTFANLASTRSGSGGTLSGSIAFQTLTTSFQTVFTTSAAGTYAANNFDIQARFSVANTQIEFQITLNDAAVGNPNIDEDVNGNLNINVNRRIANGALADPITIAEPTFGAMSGSIL